MEVAPELQFKHYTVREAGLPAVALLNLDPGVLDSGSICCDLGRHVFNPDHTDSLVAEALSTSHWFGLDDWAAQRRGGADA